MRPRNKTERRVVELSATLPPLRSKDSAWIDKDYKRTYGGKGFCYYLVMERCKEYQVIRYYYKTSRSLFEFMQLWINEDHRCCLAKNRFMGVDSWVRDSEMTIKDWFDSSYRYTYLGGVDRIGWSGVIVRSLLPALRQRGLKRSCHKVTPHELCIGLLRSNRIETLFKLGQYRLVEHFADGFYGLDRYWQSIRVALRHGYHWDSNQEIRDWCDMICDLEELGLDTRNPHYICPANLKEAHQHWTDKLHRKRKIEELEWERKTIAKYEPTFRANRERFFGMVFTDGEIDIQIIPTAMGIKEEGIAMHHCVGGYYNQPNSLILSAKIDGERIETIEVSLRDYTLVQSRGLQNCQTKYHNRIVNLINENMNEIKKRNLRKAV